MTTHPATAPRRSHLYRLLFTSSLVFLSLLIPGVRQRLLVAVSSVPETPPAADSHDAAAHRTTTAVEAIALSTAAQANLGLNSATLLTINRSDYFRSIRIPGVVVDRPGRTQIHVSAPLTGVITHVHSLPGEAVTPGTLLFEIRLTHEELVTAQTDFLKTLGELEVEQREVTRLEQVAESGALSGRTLLERRYSRDRLQALLKAQREALRLHGLTDLQVDAIATERRLLRSLLVTAPEPDEHSHDEPLMLATDSDSARRMASNPAETQQEQPRQTAENGNSSQQHSGHLLVIEQLAASKGQAVRAGDPLCTLSDPEHLLIEGHAFAEDRELLATTAAEQWPIDALFPGRNFDEQVSGLHIARIAVEIDPQSRILPFYIELSNPRIRDLSGPNGQRTVEWKYLPGQRLQLSIPVEHWSDQFVVPASAVARDGADRLVFRRNGRLFERVPVHVLHEDTHSAVIADDGSLFIGDVIAGKSATQILMALRSKAAPVDPHAGHSH
jgi:cobalt-zinc-cadmium efflux system membrane fusion protein